jgi:hypothetical protein
VINWQLQHSGTLPLAQSSKQYDVAAWKLDCVMVGIGVAQIDLPEQCSFFVKLLLRKMLNARLYWTSSSKTISVPDRRHTAMLGSATAQKPRVMECGNFVMTSLSPTFAGREAINSRLYSHISTSPVAKHKTG